MINGSITTKVRTDDLKEKAEHATADIKAFSEALDEIAILIRSSDSFWVGAGGDEARVQFDIHLSRTKDVLNELMGYPKELLDYFHIYSEAIASANRIADYSI